MKILALGANWAKFCLHNMWATRRLEMQKLGAGFSAGVGCRESGLGVEWGGRVPSGMQGGC